MQDLRSLVLNYMSFGKKTDKVCDKIPDAPKSPAGPTYHKPGGYKVYKTLTLLVCLPMIALMAANTFIISAEHPHRAEFVPYDYLRKRDKRFPWGDGNRKLFHNPDLNALKDGYEYEEDHTTTEGGDDDGPTE